MKAEITQLSCPEYVQYLRDFYWVNWWTLIIVTGVITIASFIFWYLLRKKWHNDFGE